RAAGSRAWRVGGGSSGLSLAARPTRAPAAGVGLSEQFTPTRPAVSPRFHGIPPSSAPEAARRLMEGKEWDVREGADGNLGRAAGSDLPPAVPALPEGEGVRRAAAHERSVPRVRLPLRARAGLLPGGDVRQLLPGGAGGRAADVGHQRVAGAQLDAG